MKQRWFPNLNLAWVKGGTFASKSKIRQDATLEMNLNNLNMDLLGLKVIDNRQKCPSGTQ